MEQKVIQGTHGTSEFNARNIKHGRFKANPGRAGTGIYFWATENREINLRLARTWAEYRRISPNNRCIIIAEIRANVNEYLNLEELRARIYELAVQHGILEDNHLTRLFDLFIEKEEGKLKHKIKFCTVKLAPPITYTDYPMKIFGPPLCCVARTGSCVNIKEIIKNGEL